MTTTLYQLELNQNEVNCGSSHVIQLRSGNFIILDGGYFTAGEEDRLYRFLTERSVGMPRITAWYFSHAHQDHVGNFIQFMRKYAAKVQIQTLLYSFHPIDLSNVTCDWKSSDPATVKAFYETVAMYGADIGKVTLHKGDRFTFEEVTMDVVYTYEDLYPEPASFNDYSAVIRTTVRDHTVLWLGDVSVKASKVLLRDTARLACDMVQVAHHGNDSHDLLCDLYQATGAKVALWPTADYNFQRNMDHATSRFLLYRMGIQEHIVSGFGTTALPLPYIPGTANKSRKRMSLEKPPNLETMFSNPEGSPSAFRYLTPDSMSQDSLSHGANNDGII